MSPKELLDTMLGYLGFVAEIDEDGRAHLRFGDGDLGHQPAAMFRCAFQRAKVPAADCQATATSG